MTKPEKPTHYTVRCISIYERDEDLLDAQVAELKRLGLSKANRSMVIRLELAQLDIGKALVEATQPVRTPEQHALIARHCPNSYESRAVSDPVDSAREAGAR